MQGKEYVLETKRAGKGSHCSRAAAQRKINAKKIGKISGKKPKMKIKINAQLFHCFIFFILRGTVHTWYQAAPTSKHSSTAHLGQSATLGSFSGLKGVASFSLSRSNHAVSGVANCTRGRTCAVW